MPPSGTQDAVAESSRRDVAADVKDPKPDDQEEEEDDDEEVEEAGQAGGDGAAAKKKRKPRKKKAAAGEIEVSAPIPPPNAPVARDINALLQQLALNQPNRREGKAPDEYKFWNTQPVPKFETPNLLQTTTGSKDEKPEGAILPDKVCQASVKAKPEKLIDGFEWCLIDLENSEELQEFYDLLYNHYVEDTDGSFRFNYSTEFLAWSLKPPNWKKEWHIGVRTKATSEGKKGKLVASITGVPATLRVRDNVVNAVEINFLAIHRKLRNKRLAPVLIKEVTRVSYQNGIYQALYTAGTLLPTPISTCRYYHRSLDWSHLYKTDFSHLPKGSTELRQKLKYKVETQPTIKGWRQMTTADLPAVKTLLVRYLERFQLRPEFSDEELAHYICSDFSKGVVSSFVVENAGKITDFVSYYLLESTVLKSSKKETIKAAYLYYYATDAAFTSGPPAKVQEALQGRLQLLIHDALISAKQADFHVFNALTLLDNPLFLREEKFEPGDGKLHYYLFNWRTQVMNGGIDEFGLIDPTKMDGVGVVML